MILDFCGWLLFSYQKVELGAETHESKESEGKTVGLSSSCFRSWRSRGSWILAPTQIFFFFELHETQKLKSPNNN